MEQRAKEKGVQVQENMLEQGVQVQENNLQVLAMNLRYS